MHLSQRDLEPDLSIYICSKLCLRTESTQNPEKAESFTYPERSLVIHGSVCVSKLPDEHSLKPAFQDSRDSKPMQWELWDRWQSDRIRNTPSTTQEGSGPSAAARDLAEGRIFLLALSFLLKELVHLKKSITLGQLTWQSTGVSPKRNIKWVWRRPHTNKICSYEIMFSNEV